MSILRAFPFSPRRAGLFGWLLLVFIFQDPAKQDGQSDNGSVKPLGAGNAKARIPQTFSLEKTNAMFRALDANEDQWLSLREMRARMQTDRREYSVFDTDHDGRVSSDEFIAQIRKLVENGAVFPGLLNPAGATESRAESAPKTPAESRPASGPFRFEKLPAKDPAKSVGK